MGIYVVGGQLIALRKHLPIPIVRMKCYIYSKPGKLERLNMKIITPLILVTSLFIAPPMAMGEVLLLDAMAEVPSNTASGLPRPVRGTSMEDVYNKFGAPQSESPEVGKPPITRWVYEKFTVYFEFDRVIETVIHR